MRVERHRFLVRAATPPIIEVDSQAEAIYIRFKKTAVAKTVSRPCQSMHLAVDLDSDGDVIGIEAVGVKQFTMQSILKKASVDAPDIDYSRARYIPACDLVGA
jgi:uncharacterized protein YuzE